MKGVILAGGLGSRLLPLTKVTNKHLLPVYDKPMVYYPIQCLGERRDRGHPAWSPVATARATSCTCSENGDAFGLEGNPLRLSARRGWHRCDALEYRWGTSPPASRSCVILGDNLIEGNIKSPTVEAFKQQGKGGKILLKEVHDPERFGVAELDPADKVLKHRREAQASPRATSP
jgi:glucose-1-phosphate thymidylyltransferase